MKSAKNIGYKIWAGTSRTALFLIVTVGLQGLVSPAFAACPGTIVNGETQVVTQVLAAGEDCTVEAGGSIAPPAGVIAINGSDNHTILNDGAISTTGFNAFGINVDNNNTITNSGTISTTGFNADGINVDNNNTITNSSSISTTGDNAEGMNLDNNNTVTNSGSISTTGPSANGITAGDNNAITNSGSISTTDIFSDGIFVDNNSSITNSGSISATGNFSDGITAFGDNNTITNSGGISTTGNNAEGIDANNSSTITNSGSISTTGDNAQGINVDNNNTITNSGLISATGAGSDAVRFSGGTNELILNPGSRIIGSINFLQATNTLTVGNGLSIAYTFTGNLPGTINTSGAPFAVNGLQVAVLDPTALSQHDEMLADLTSGIFNSVHARLGGAGGSSSNGFGGMSLGMSSMMQLGGGSMMNVSTQDVGPTTSSDGSGFWAQAFGGNRNVDASAPTVASDHEYYGAITGIDGWLMPGIRIGAFAGASRADLETAFDTQDIEADSYFGGAYASLEQNGWFAHLMLSAGRTDYDSTRQVANNLVATGIQSATASYDGTFVSPELTVGSTFNIGGLTIEPSARVRYAHLSLDGYSETGASDNLSIGDRNVSLWQGRVQLAMPFSSENGTFAPRIGVEAWTSDSDTISAVLLGQAISFNPGGDDDKVTGFVGATASIGLSAGTNLFLDGEVHIGDDGISRTEARVGVKVSF